MSDPLAQLDYAAPECLKSSRQIAISTFMNELLLRLRGMDGSAFQRFCFQLLKERHPTANLRYVEAPSGDEGLDIFCGDMDGGLTIWQCKAFQGGIGESQKGQIRESFNTAMKYFKPSRWVLCLSVDMDTSTHRWFQRYQHSHRLKTAIGLYSASDIIHEVLHRRTLRNTFFPNVAIDPVELKRLITRTGELSTEELERINESNVEDYLERLKERDARFNYEVIYSGDLGSTEGRRRMPGLVASLSKQGMTVNAIARDIEALRNDPPKISFVLRGSGIRKQQEIIRTGRQQEFTADEVSLKGSTFPLFEGVPKSLKDFKLIVGLSDELREKLVKVRLLATLADRSVEYPMVEIQLLRIGTEEAEFATTGTHLPFELRMVTPIGASRSGTISYVNRFVGYEVRKIRKFLRFLSILRDGGQMSMFDFERERLVFAASAAPEAVEGYKSFEALIEDLALVADTYDVEIALPENVTDDDIDALVTLKTYAESGTMPVGNLAFTLVKSEINAALPEEAFRSLGIIRAVNERLEPRPKIFGVPIDTGPCAITISNFSVENFAETMSRFRAAKLGEGVSFLVRSDQPARFELMDSAEELPNPPVTG